MEQEISRKKDDLERWIEIFETIFRTEIFCSIRLILNRNFRKFWSNGTRPFFLEIWKFRKFPVPFGISNRYESAPGPSAVKNHKMAASLSSLHWMQNNLPQFEPVLDCLFSTLGSDFLENCGLVVPNFLRFSSQCLHTSRAYFPTRKVRKLLSSRENGV